MVKLTLQNLSLISSGCALLYRRMRKHLALSAADESGPPQASIALSPAIIMVRCKPGQSTTQTLTITNHTAGEVRFDVATEDVVVREGKRSYSPAGRIANGIAASSVVAPASVVVKAGEEASVQVTFTLPPETWAARCGDFLSGRPR